MKTVAVIIVTSLISTFTHNDANVGDNVNTNEITFEEVFGSYDAPVFTPVDSIQVMEEVEDVTLGQDIEDLVTLEAFLSEEEKEVNFCDVFRNVEEPVFTPVDAIEVLEEL